MKKREQKVVEKLYSPGPNTFLYILGLIIFAILMLLLWLSVVLR